MKGNIPYHVICKAKMGDIVDDDIRAFIESELVLAIIQTYDLSRMPKEQNNT